MFINVEEVGVMEQIFRALIMRTSDESMTVHPINTNEILMIKQGITNYECTSMNMVIIRCVWRSHIFSGNNGSRKS